MTEELSPAEIGPFPCWEFVNVDGEVPQSRSGHTCSLHKNRFLYVFGGFDGSSCFDDLYVLDLETRRWRQIEAGGDRPSGRASHSAVTDELTGAMYIFGGSGSHFGYTNKRDLSEFCFETECWRLLSNPMEDTPSARYGQSMVAYELGLYIWGGTHGTNYPTDMYRFDLCSLQWEFVVTSGELPCGRYRHQAMVKDHLMYIVGGSGINRYGDVFTFNFLTNAWQRLLCTGTDLSDGRYAHTAVLHEGHIYLYGGNDGVRHDDLQQLDLETCIWSRVAVHGHCPPGRDFHGAVLRKGSMVIFGGSNGMRRHNDVFEFHLTPNIPCCTLSSDMEDLFERAQVEEAVTASCDVVLLGREGPAHAIYCHSQLLKVRCPLLCTQLEDRTELRSQQLEVDFLQEMPGSRRPHYFKSLSGVSQKSDSDSVQRMRLQRQRKRQTRPWSAPSGNLTHCGEKEQETLSDVLQASVPLVEGSVRAPSEDSRPPSVDSRRSSVCMHHGGGLFVMDTEYDPPSGWNGHYATVNATRLVLEHFVLYLYSASTRFGQLTAYDIYQLYLTARRTEVPRLEALSLRQLQARLTTENIMAILHAASHDGHFATSVLEACKYFFLGNYEQCTDMSECESLDPKLLCELMRQHNTRMAAANSVSAQFTESSLRSESALSSTLASVMPSPSSPSPQGVPPRSPQANSRRSREDQRLLAGRTSKGPQRLIIPPCTLAQDLKRLFDEQFDTDYEVEIQEEVIEVHRFVLAARSRYFASCILTSGMSECQAGRLVIPPSTAITAESFKAFLRFIYAGDDILSVLAASTALYLHNASAFYSLTNHRLRFFCTRCVDGAFHEAHVLKLFEASSRVNIDGIQVVRKKALDYIVQHFQSVSRQPYLEELEKCLLVDVLRGVAERFPDLSSPSNALLAPQSLG